MDILISKKKEKINKNNDYVKEVICRGITLKLLLYKMLVIPLSELDVTLDDLKKEYDARNINKE